jgi:hypothetical protein
MSQIKLFVTKRQFPNVSGIVTVDLSGTIKETIHLFESSFPDLEVQFYRHMDDNQWIRINKHQDQQEL